MYFAPNPDIWIHAQQNKSFLSFLWLLEYEYSCLVISHLGTRSIHKEPWRCMGLDCDRVIAHVKIRIEISLDVHYIMYDPLVQGIHRHKIRNSESFFTSKVASMIGAKGTTPEGLRIMGAGAKVLKLEPTLGRQKHLSTTSTTALEGRNRTFNVGKQCVKIF